MRRSIVEMVGIVILSSIVGLSYNALAPDSKKVPLKGGKESRMEIQGVRMVDTDEVRFYLDNEKGTLIVDARSPEEYGLGHIPGALNVPADGFDSAWSRTSQSLAKAKFVIVYCSGGSCNTSHEVAERLQSKGVKNVAVFGDGLPGWMKAKLPLKNGSEP